MRYDIGIALLSAGLIGAGWAWWQLARSDSSALRGFEGHALDGAISLGAVARPRRHRPF